MTVQANNTKGSTEQSKTQKKKKKKKKNHNHDFDLDDVKIIDRCSQWSKRLFLEAWHSIREPNAINEHIYIPDIYKALGK